MSESEDSNDSVRLNKFLALHAGTSRREADELIAKGRVRVNGKLAVMGGRIRDGDKVTVDDWEISTDTAYEYLMLNKPTNYVCSRRQQGESPTIYDLVPEQYHTLKPVGRLDRDSSGLILLTNDGDFAQQMTHPSYRKVKQYNVTLGRALEPLHQQMISDFGVDLEDGKSQLTLERRDDARKDWIVTMSEGRNRQIRRTFLALGYTVTALHRTNFGPYILGNLETGKFQKVEKL
jgi:23S rRNA pseudouridine2605 synthase